MSSRHIISVIFSVCVKYCTFYHKSYVGIIWQLAVEHKVSKPISTYLVCVALRVAGQ